MMALVRCAGEILDRKRWVHMAMLVVGVASVLAGVIQTVTGFGSIVVLMLVLPFFFDMIDAPALALVINQIFCIVLYIKYRRHIRWDVALLPTVLYSAASLVTIRLASRLDAHTLVIALAVLLIVLSVYFLAVASRITLHPHKWVGATCGVFSGAAAGLFAIGGPPMALYFITACDTHLQYVACMQFLFAVTGAVSLAGRIIGGVLHPSILPCGAVGTVGILLGLWIGAKINGKLDAAKARTVVYIFVGVSGVILLLQNVL